MQKKIICFICLPDNRKYLRGITFKYYALGFLKKESSYEGCSWSSLKQISGIIHMLFGAFCVKHTAPINLRMKFPEEFPLIKLQEYVFSGDVSLGSWEVQSRGQHTAGTTISKTQGTFLSSPLIRFLLYVLRDLIPK